MTAWRSIRATWRRARVIRARCGRGKVRRGRVRGAMIRKMRRGLRWGVTVQGDTTHTKRPHEIERYAVDSSNIKTVGYEDGLCVIEFTNGQIYSYAMPPATFEAFARAESKGRHFNQQIRGKVDGHKLT